MRARRLDRTASAHRAIGLFLLAAGLAIGSVVARDAPSLHFKKVSLFEAMRQLHAHTGTDIVFVNAEAQERSFDLPPGRAEEAITSAAQHFGRTAVPLSRITVLRSSIRAATTSSDRIAAVREWVGDRTRIQDFVSAVLNEEKRLSQELPPGSRGFDQLTPAQRQDLLSLLRMADTKVRARYLSVLMQEWDTAQRPGSTVTYDSGVTVPAK